jgi:FG-GAP repeat/FG-GAP-like repeat
MRRSVTLVTAMACAFSLPAILGSPSPASAVSDHSPDFNGDGYADLVVGAVRENNSRGLVHVLYGSPTGPSAAGSIAFGEDTPSVPGAAGPNDYFGAFFAYGNVNGDAYTDLVVASPSDAVSGRPNAGSVTLFRGSASGLNLAGRQFTDAFGGGTVRANEYFGNGIAMGDYDGDGDDDIAIGIPLDNYSDAARSFGRVKILRAHNGGFSPSNVWAFTHSTLPASVRANFVFGFGSSLQTLEGNADFDGLAVGIPEYSARRYASGGVAIYRGTTSSMRLTEFVAGPYGTESFYGTSLSAGDLTGDGEDDLVVGTPDAANGEGRVDIIPLARNRTNYAGPFRLSSSNALHPPATGDGFGFFTAVVDDGPTSYLYVGAPGNEVGSRVNAGSMFIFKGDSVARPTRYSTSMINQPGWVRDGLFGFQITVLDAKNDGFSDVVVAAPGDSVLGTFQLLTGAGSIWYYDSDDGLPQLTNPVEYNQNTPGIPDRAEAGDGFGLTLSYL